MFALHAGYLLAMLLFVLMVLKKRRSVSIWRVARGTYEAAIEEDGVTRVKEKFTVFSPAMA
jgi:HlyD family secretion protein